MVKIDCNCGLNHEIKMDNIAIKRNGCEDVVKHIPIPKSELSAFMVCDSNTYKAAGNRVENSFLTQKIDFDKIILDPRDFGFKHQIYPTQTLVQEITSKIGNSPYFLISVGTGTITDLVRRVASLKRLSFLSIPTAPSVDGFSSSVASIIVENKKTTFSAVKPSFILADIDVLSESPIRMKAAGFGDLMGKKTSSLDWQLAHFLQDEQVCYFAIECVHQALQNTVKSFERTHHNYTDKTVIELTKGLLLSGLTISMVGSSRPASGSEHHISHTLEHQAIQGKIPHYLHGECVALGTFIMMDIYKRVFGTNFQEFKSIIETEGKVELRESAIENRKEIFKKIYGPIAKAITENWKKRYGVSEVNAQRKRETLEKLKTHWKEIQKLVYRSLENFTGLREIALKGQIPINPEKFKLKKETLFETIVCAKEIRERYTLLTALDDLGALEYFVNLTLANQ